MHTQRMRRVSLDAIMLHITRLATAAGTHSYCFNNILCEACSAAAAAAADAAAAAAMDGACSVEGLLQASSMCTLCNQLCFILLLLLLLLLLLPAVLSGAVDNRDMLAS
jgi:hypothetical protein